MPHTDRRAAPRFRVHEAIAAAFESEQHAFRAIGHLIDCSARGCRIDVARCIGVPRIGEDVAIEFLHGQQLLKMHGEIRREISTRSGVVGYGLKFIAPIAPHVLEAMFPTELGRLHRSLGRVAVVGAIGEGVKRTLLDTARTNRRIVVDLADAHHVSEAGLHAIHVAMDYGAQLRNCSTDVARGLSAGGVCRRCSDIDRCISNIF